MKRTYEEIKDENNIIHHLLPPLRESRYNLRNPKPRIGAKTRIKRTDNSFINFAIKHFEWTLSVIHNANSNHYFIMDLVNDMYIEIFKC